MYSMTVAQHANVLHSTPVGMDKLNLLGSATQLLFCCLLWQSSHPRRSAKVAEPQAHSKLQVSCMN
jgi:hypothetical protein